MHSCAGLTGGWLGAQEVPEVSSASVNLATETALVRVQLSPEGERTAVVPALSSALASPSQQCSRISPKAPPNRRHLRL